jgi:hypothetical protein
MIPLKREIYLLRVHKFSFNVILSNGWEKAKLGNLDKRQTGCLPKINIEMSRIHEGLKYIFMRAFAKLSTPFFSCREELFTALSFVSCSRQKGFLNPNIRAFLFHLFRGQISPTNFEVET